MKKVIAILPLIFISLLAIPQEKKSGIEYKFDVERVKNSDSVTYFGWDFSQVRILDSKVTDSRSAKIELIPAWLEYAHQKVSDDKVRKLLSRNYFQSELSKVEPLFKSVADNNFIDESATLTIDSIKSIVAAYPITGNGIGLVFIPDLLQKYNRSVTAYITFFDIATEEVLYCCYMRGLAGGKGIKQYYGEGLIECPLYFFKKYYLHIR